jgi:hypothetical protein
MQRKSPLTKEIITFLAIVDRNCKPQITFKSLKFEKRQLFRFSALNYVNSTLQLQVISVEFVKYNL